MADVEIEEIELEIEDEVIATPELNDDLEYPCVVMTGITLREELDFFGAYKVDRHVAIPLYIRNSIAVKRLGYIELTSRYFLMLNNISTTAYKLRLYKTPKDVVPLDYTDGKFVEGFIKI